MKGIEPMVTIDGNEAAALIAHQINEVIAIYPITPSSPMGEWSDQWSSEGRKNIWGVTPRVVEMQSEGGAAGALHGALQAGALATTFTSSQGLLLMIPNMYKIAGELTSMVMHVAARALAAQALSIFGDHSDVMATRGTGFALLCSNSVQEVADFAVIAQAAALESRVPFLHFFDGFRTSHEVAKLDPPSKETLRAMISDQLVHEHRARSLSPDRPVLRGAAQNPDVYFQGRESVNPYYRVCPKILQDTMDKFATLTGHAYRLFDYVGAPDAERVIVIMGSGAEVVQETVEYLVERGEKIGLLKVRLYRPFDGDRFLAALPASVKSLAVLDRVKEPGSGGEPLYLDVVAAAHEAGKAYRIVGGRYGLGSKEFTPAMVKSVFDEIGHKEPKNHFTVGINDDVTHTSLEYDPFFSTEDRDTVRALFYGLGADGTVGANKNSIKIIGEDTDNDAQGYFVYDSKKSGSTTVSHLRFGPRPIRSSYLIAKASFIACHQFNFLEHMDVLKAAEHGATFLLNSFYGPNEIWDHLPRATQETILHKKLRFYVIDAYDVAQKCGMGGRINTIMQTCFFAISGVLPRDEAIAAIKKSIYKTYGKRGEAVVEKNYAAVDNSLANLFEVKVPAEVTAPKNGAGHVPAGAPTFFRILQAPMIAGNGDNLPVSVMPVDGTWPTGSSQWEKRNISLEIPVWDEELCIQCGKCVLVCPHSVIRAKVYESDKLMGSPATFKSVKARWKDGYFGPELEGAPQYTLQIAPEDCTGCSLCVEVCPAKSKSQAKHKAINMESQPPLRATEAENWEFFLKIPETTRSPLSLNQVKDVQLLQPLFEFSGACAGCGETPYIKLLTQLFGDRTVIANATGCSSIYGGNLPTTPYTKNAAGRGPAWSNSLFEDNAEFGLGMRLALDHQKMYARELVKRLSSVIGDELATALLVPQTTPAEIEAQRSRVGALKQKLAGTATAEGLDLLSLADALVEKSVWILGGDGWAYDIGFGGLDHVLASGANVNILVMDTEVYSNTGGQMSKSTPRAAVAKFAAGGKRTAKKDLAMLAMAYGSVYVARVAMGGSDVQTVKAFLEAEAYPGPSLILAFSHCIAHGYDMVHGLEQQKNAVASGYWPLLRFNPMLTDQGKNPLQLDSRAPSLAVNKYMYNETRFSMLVRSDPDTAAKLSVQAQQDVDARWKHYADLAAVPGTNVAANSGKEK
jgi:pyruvate-ferredoxin/flavodoxin oxidoreductase